eukprot:1371084-Pyramimonas_sp.AAC.1
MGPPRFRRVDACGRLVAASMPPTWGVRRGFAASRPWPPRGRLVAAHHAWGIRRGFATFPPVAASWPPRALDGSGEIPPRCRPLPPRGRL